MTTASPSWFKSSYSNNGGVCVEVAANFVAPYGVVPVRDSKNTEGPTLTFSAVAFVGFIDAVRTGAV